MRTYLEWLLTEVLPKIAREKERAHARYLRARERVMEFDRDRRAADEMHTQLVNTVDDLERLCRALGATDDNLRPALSPPPLCEVDHHAED